MTYKRTIYTGPSTVEKKKEKPNIEETFLLNELSKQSKVNLFFHVNAFLVPLLPLWTFSQILGLNIEEHVVRIVIVTAICSVILWFACNEMRLRCKGKLNKKSPKGGQNCLEGTGKKGSPADKNAVALVNSIKITESEACGFALFHNNCYFVALVLLLSHVGFQKLDVENNYVISMIFSALVVALLASASNRHK